MVQNVDIRSRDAQSLQAQYFRRPGADYMQHTGDIGNANAQFDRFE